MPTQDYAEARAINAAVNAGVGYRTDMDLYGQWDRWVVLATTPAEGDCEDSALTKRDRLLRAGWLIQDLRLACVFTETEEGQRRLKAKRHGRWVETPRGVWAIYGVLNGMELEIMGDHAVLIVRTRDGDVIADNRYPDLVRLSETPYVFDRIQIAGTPDWEHGRM